MIRILVVDDSALMRRLLATIFRSQDDFEVAVARDGVEALQQLHAFQPDVVTLDIHMPNMDGLACLDQIMLERPTRVLMVSSLTEEGAEETIEAMARGAADYFPKPDGAVSLAMDELAPALIEKVRATARQRVRLARGLANRVRLRAQSTIRAPAPGLAAAKDARHAYATPEPARKAEIATRVVLVGCSTGGPPALDILLEPLAPDFPWPIVIAQHMPASFTGPLARRLDRLCALSVHEVVRPEPIVPGHVYVARGDADIIVVTRGGQVLLSAAPPLAEHRWHPSVDRLVATAMNHISPRNLVGVLLTGMGSDGASEMARLRAAGGRTIAEAEETAVVWGMPGELVKAGGAEVVLPMEKIAAHLTGLSS